MSRRGCYPGSFDPLTVAHLLIAQAAVDQCGLDTIDLVISRSALGKDTHHHPLDDRLEAISRAARSRPWLRGVVTDRRLIAEIAEGYDVVVVGADKWAQLFDVAFYGGSSEARDAAVAALPEVACAPRAGHSAPAAGALGAGVRVLEVPDWVPGVSATAVRAGAEHWRWRPEHDRPTRRGPE